jgi:nucleoside-diphosphate-sugar epimerase
MKIFLAGGTGFVGGHVRNALMEKGHEILLLTHHREVGTEEGIINVKGDVSHPEIYGEVMRGCDAVINLVGIIREFPDKQVTFTRLHREATRNLVDSAQRARGKKISTDVGTRHGPVQYQTTIKPNTRQKIHTGLKAPNIPFSGHQ